MKLKKLIIPLTLALSICSSIIAPAASGEIACINEDYVKQYQTNWCWAATGLNIFVGVDGTVPSKKTDKKFLLELVQGIVDKYDISVDTSLPTYDRYDIPGGLSYTADIATELLADNGYDDLYYEVAKDSNGRKVIRTFKFLMGDIEYGCPSAAYLTATRTGGYDHIVLINGADSMFSDSDDYEIRYFNSESDSNIWVPYNDFISGETKTTNYKKYDGTCEFSGGF